MARETSHTANCVCVSCLAMRLPARVEVQRRVAEPLGSQLGYERGTPIAALNRAQRRHLAGFVKAWNRTRELRGLEPMLADHALTEGLSALEKMTKDALAALEKA